MPATDVRATTRYVPIVAKLKNAHHPPRPGNLSHKCTDRTVTFGLYLISYVLTLETHIKLLARGVQGLYQLLQRGESLPGGPLHIDKAEQPLLHDILDRLGVLEVAHQHSTFRWDPAVVDRLIYPWEASQQSSLPLRSSAPDSSLSVWPSDLSNQLTHNSYHGAYDLETTSLNNFYPALNTAFDPALNTAFSSALGTTFNTALNPALGPTLNPTLDPTLNPALHTASSTNMYVEQEMKQNDWTIGLHLG